MVELDAKVREPRPDFPGEPFMAEVNGRWVKAEDREHAQSIVDAAKMAYSLGARQARRDIRRSLGLRDWGGDVTCLDR